MKKLTAMIIPLALLLADFGEFAREQGCDYAACDMITDGYCFINSCKWEENPDGSFGGKAHAAYYHKLDGSMTQPEKVDAQILMSILQIAWIQ